MSDIRDLTDAMIPRRSAPEDSAPSLAAGDSVQGENKRVSRMRSSRIVTFKNRCSSLSRAMNFRGKN